MSLRSKEALKKYLVSCHELTTTELRQVDKNARLNWYGRMDFDLETALIFLLSRESLHHGEMLSVMYLRKLDIPPALKETWGF